MLHDRNPASPETLGGTTVVLERYVEDVDAAFDRAVRAGAKPRIRPATCSLEIDIAGWSIHSDTSGVWLQYWRP